MSQPIDNMTLHAGHTHMKKLADLYQVITWTPPEGGEGGNKRSEQILGGNSLGKRGRC
jgi:hypothetical protein